MEHNAVMRPLRVLADRGVEVVKVSGLVTWTPHPAARAQRVASGSYT